MVFPDIGDPFELNNLNQKKSTASLMDRFFSFLIDYLVISPFVLFLLYTTFNNGFHFWKQNPTAPENEQFFIIFSIGYVVYFCLIQSLFITLWRATPGQYFLKIRFDFHESNDLIFLRAFARQFSFWLSFALLGIPFLSVMTNRKRRTFYDRIGDVSMVSTKNEVQNSTYESEYRYWQSFVATLIVFVGFLFTALVWKNYSKIVSRSASFVVMNDKKYFCSELDTVAIDERLSVAVALNFAGQLSDSCLDREADFVLWKQKYPDFSLAYYAKSLTAEDAAREKNYHEESCAGQNTADFASLTIGCKLSYSFLSGDMDRLYSALNEDNFLSEGMKYELGIILEKSEDQGDNFAKIEKYNSLKAIRKYQVVEMLSRATPGAGRSPASDNTRPEQNEKLIDLIEGL